MSNIFLVKCIAVACRDALQAKHDLSNEEVGQIAAAAYEAASQALERTTFARCATKAVMAGAGTYYVGEARIDSRVWVQLNERPWSYAEAERVSFLATEGKQRIVVTLAGIERLAERGEWVRQ